MGQDKGRYRLFAARDEREARQWAEWRASRRRLLQIGAFGGGALALGGLGGLVRPVGAQETPAASGPPKAGGKVTMGIVADVQSFDPPVPGDNMSIWTMLNIYDQLVRVGKDGKSVDPCLAESWEVSPDQLTYTFKLRQGVKFHDGTDMKVSDIKYCIDRLAFGDNGWKPLFVAVESTAAPDANTFVLKVKQPWVPMLADMALFAASIYPEAAHKAQADKLFEAPIGTGAFKFESWQKGSAIALKKNPDYWLEGQPYLDEATFAIVADANTRIVQLQSGEMDIATDVPFSQIESLDASGDIHVQTGPIGRVDYVAINHKRPPFDDKNVRLALNYAVDKQAIIDNVLYGKGTIAQSGLPRMLDWNDQVQPYPYDPEKAKQLLDQSKGKGGFKTTLGVTAGDAEHAATATIIKDQLAEIGVNIDIYEQESAALYVDTFQGMKYDLAIQYHTTDIVDPSQITRYALSSRADGTGALWTGYVNPKIDELAKAAQTETDPEKRKQMYFECQKLGFDDAYILYLYFPDSRTGLRQGITGFQVLPTSNYRMWEVWKA